MGKLFKYDLSVRLQDTEEMLFRLKQRLLEEGFHIKGVQHKEVKEQVYNKLMHMLTFCSIFYLFYLFRLRCNFFFSCDGFVICTKMLCCESVCSTQLNCQIQSCATYL